MHSPFGPERDLFYMKQALRQAQYAFDRNEVPIGAVVVNSEGIIIGRGYNRVEQENTQLAHAELTALKRASKKMNDWRLLNCWLYVTLEPCIMCMAAIRLSRLAGVVYGASSPLFGFSLDNMTDSRVYKNDTLIIPGVGHQEGGALLKRFFQQERKKDKHG